MRGAVEALHPMIKKTGIVGFCFGGSLALPLAAVPPPSPNAWDAAVTLHPSSIDASFIQGVAIPTDILVVRLFFVWWVVGDERRSDQFGCTFQLGHNQTKQNTTKTKQKQNTTKTKKTKQPDARLDMNFPPPLLAEARAIAAAKSAQGLEVLVREFLGQKHGFSLRGFGNPNDPVAWPAMRAAFSDAAAFFKKYLY